MSATTLPRVGGSRSGEQAATQIKGPQQRVPVRSTKQERYLTDLRFCCAAKMVTASVARESDAYRDSSNRLLDGARVQPTLMVYTMAYTDG